MTDYDDYDGDEPFTADEERDLELVLDAQDEERRAEQEKAAASAEPDGDDGECHAEMIDGSYTYCVCPDCDTRQAEDDEQFAECA